MNETIIKTLSFYCDSEIEELKNNEMFIRLQNLVDELSFILVCEYGKEFNNKSENLYLSLTVLTDKEEMIEIFDDGFLSASTPMVIIDKKYRCSFLSWKDKEFIEDLYWLIDNLEKIKNKA